MAILKYIYLLVTPTLLLVVIEQLQQAHRKTLEDYANLADFRQMREYLGGADLTKAIAHRLGFVAKLAGTDHIIGFCLLQYNGHGQVAITALGVLKDYQHGGVAITPKGTGSALLLHAVLLARQYVEGSAVQAKPYVVDSLDSSPFLGAMSTNSAIGFYATSGFQRVKDPTDLDDDNMPMYILLAHDYEKVIRQLRAYLNYKGRLDNRSPSDYAPFLKLQAGSSNKEKKKPAP